MLLLRLVLPLAEPRLEPDEFVFTSERRLEERLLSPRLLFSFLFGLTSLVGLSSLEGVEGLVVVGLVVGLSLPEGLSEVDGL